MKKMVAIIGMSGCTVLGVPFKVISLILGLLIGAFTISNLFQVIIVIGSFITIMVSTMQQAFTVEALIYNLIMSIIASSLVAGVVMVLGGLWIFIASILIKLCTILKVPFDAVENKLYQGYSFCKRYLIF